MDAKKAAITAGYLVFFLWLVTPVLLLIFFPDAGQRGQFGDGYGFITSLFSGITIIGLIYTIYLQREDIKTSKESLAKQMEELELTKQALINQQKELRDNRAEIIQNRAEIKLQHQIANYQRFENTFFHMTSLYKNISEKYNKEEFVEATTQMLSLVKELGTLKEMRSIYKAKIGGNLFKKYYLYLEHFRTTVEIIHEVSKHTQESQKYLRIYFSLLTYEEKLFLFYDFNLRSRPKLFDFFKEELFKNMSSNNINANVLKCFDGVNRKLVDKRN